VTTVPLVSAIVPAFNAERFLEDALRSIFAQEFDDLETIVVDDGSTDGTADVVRAFGDAVRSLTQPNGGVALARNAGIAAARGAFVAFLDADDLWAPHKLRLQVEALRADPTADYVLGEMQCFADQAFAVPGWMRKALFEPHVAHSTGTMLVRRTAFDRVGLFDPTVVPAETMDWFARAVDAGLRGRTVDVVVLRRRFHESNSAAYGVGAVNAQLLEALRRSIARKRATRLPAPVEGSQR
jgi:glycosyltransferase involved in cell wall biosynthesis